MKIVLSAAIILYFSLILLIFIFQRTMMYHPFTAIGIPAAYGLDMKETFIPSSDNVKLQLWYKPAKLGFPTLIYFHGNGGNLAMRATIFQGFIQNGFGLVALSYRGFGKSSGAPSEQGIYADARAAIEYANTQLGVTQDHIIYYGESLGTGVAVQMASEHKPSLLVLQAAYTSIEKRASELYFFIIGARHLVRDKYDSLTKIAHVHCPLLMLHGENDSVIPLVHAQVLFAAANEPKQLIIYTKVNHADFSNAQIIVPLLETAKKYGLIR